ncbi:hypothetical protein N7533_001650 [Penicillium manginii]|jgi:hypothetical protein|uniref:uncharacterized protein n=1 Tax=Penicillium manginii TaxID=203109 RepID=UPI00254907EA|nr:uncharacterized protein N7533_001650 [Penicillium manginii]KAJ5762969.1 hypothetical protein N7533_001650 [Penicillium manginii]
MMIAFNPLITPTNLQAANEFGPGIYTTPDFSVGLGYAKNLDGSPGVMVIFKRPEPDSHNLIFWTPSDAEVQALLETFTNTEITGRVIWLNAGLLVD